MEFNFRGKNFSKDEIVDLICVCKRYSYILNSRQTNRVTKAMKDKEWIKVTNEFNCTSRRNHYRTTAELQRCYIKLRKEEKIRLAKEKKSIKKTGGGPPEQRQEFLDFGLSNPEIVGISNPYDCNGE